MNCANHPENPATAYCRTCGKALCQSCARNVRGVIYCEDCLASRVEGAPAGAGARQGFDNWVAQNTGFPAATTPGVLNPDAPNPAIAGILSGFLPFGTGVMYCGEFTRALIHAGVFVALITIAVNAGDRFGPFVGLGLAFWYFFMIFDSVRVAKAKQWGQPVPDLFGVAVTQSARSAFGAPAAGVVAGEAGAAGAVTGGPYTPPIFDRRSRMPVGPIILIGLGILFLLNSLDVFYLRWDIVVWIAFIVWGLFLLFRRFGGGACQCSRCIGYGVTGPAMILTVGVLGLLDDYTRFDWGRTWPLFLIVLGGIKLLQMAGSTAGHIEPGSPPPSSPSASAADVNAAGSESQVNNG